MKTLKDITTYKKYDQDDCGYGWNISDVESELRQTAIEWIKNLQYKDSEYSVVLDVLDVLPDIMKGEIVKDQCLYLASRFDTKFRYGAEYGMIAWIMYFFNIKEGELK